MTATAATPISVPGTSIPEGREPEELRPRLATTIATALTAPAWLDAADRAVGNVVGAVLGGGTRNAVADVLHGRFLGHPLHPVLSDVPIGLWTASLLLDVAGDDRGAAVLSFSGVGASVATAATGLADWSATDGRDRRLGLVHGLINSAALGLQIGSLAARVAGARRRAFGLSAVGYAISAAAAWVGGELVYANGVGIDRTAWTTGPADWTAVMRLEDLADGATQGAAVEDRRILVTRNGNNIWAIEASCTHRGAPLEEGAIEAAAGTVTCPWHGSCFRLTDGTAVRGPAVVGQPRLQARINAGRVEVRGRPAE